MTRLFISYVSLDSSKVDTIVSHLRSQKIPRNSSHYDVWQDKHNIRVGQDWWEEIVNAIINCDVFIFMVSSKSVMNNNCCAELSYARRRNRPILPLVLDGEFFYNGVTGKNDIAYWSDIPQELGDLRSQFLFYEGTSFLQRLETSTLEFMRESKRWRDIPADRPRDPRAASDATNNAITLYDEAWDYAFRMEFSTAERLFQKLVNLNDPDFGEDAHEWILILREYQTILNMNARDSTRHKAQARWQRYYQQFPKQFVPMFDPNDFQSQFLAQVPLMSVHIFDVSTDDGVLPDVETKGHTLEKKDPQRYYISLSNNSRILEQESAKARKLEEYDWMELFAEAWTKVAPGNTRAYEDLATAFIRSNQPQKAIQVGNKLVAISKLNHIGYQTLGRAHSLLGDWEKARRWQEKALIYVPPVFRQFLLIELSKTYVELGLVDKAIIVLEELLPMLDKYQKTFYEEKLAHLKSIKGK